MPVLNPDTRTFNSYAESSELHSSYFSLYIHMHFVLPKTVKMLHVPTQLFLSHFLTCAHSTNTFYLQLLLSKRGLKGKMNYRLLFLSIPLYVTTFPCKLLANTESNRSKKGNDKGPWLFHFLEYHFLLFTSKVLIQTENIISVAVNIHLTSSVINVRYSLFSLCSLLNLQTSWVYWKSVFLKHHRLYT